MTRDDSRRPLKVQVKSGRGRTLSSKLWLDRQLNDPYVARARREGFRSRAAYKLTEIDKQSCCGSAPAWSISARRPAAGQVVAKRVGAAGAGTRGGDRCSRHDGDSGVEFVRPTLVHRRPTHKGAAGPPTCPLRHGVTPPATVRPTIKIMALARRRPRY
jgi:hypothetical protein